MFKIKVAYFGSSEFSAQILSFLKTFEEINEIIVFSTPDAIGNRNKVKPTFVKEVAANLGLDVYTYTNQQDILDKLINSDINVLITCAYGKILSKRVLLNQETNINIHLSLLPKWRGAAPVRRAIMNGDKKTGISLMEMVPALDAGPVYAQAEVNIKETDNSTNVYNNLLIVTKELLRSKLLKIIDKSLSKIEQDVSKVSYAKKITRKDEILDWNNNTSDLIHKINALTPKPGCYTLTNNSNVNLKIYGATYYNEKKDINKYNPGELIEWTKRGILVKTKSGAILLTKIQIPGKKKVLAGSYYNNFPKILSGISKFTN